VNAPGRLRTDAGRIWTAALRAVDPGAAVRRHVRRRKNALLAGGRIYDLDRFGNVWALGAGKAAAPMGKALETILGGRLAGGLLVTKYGHGIGLKRLETVEAGHPLPDSNSVAAAQRMAAFAGDRVAPGDLVFCLLSGGASSLLASPAEGIALGDKIRCTQALLRAGASIRELNAVRKHLSALKGGGLARRLHPATVVSVALSDVVGDDPSTIASGPTVPDPTTFSDCLEILRRLSVADSVPGAVTRRLRRGAAGEIAETPKAGDPAFRAAAFLVAGSNAEACRAAAAAARRLGYHATVLTSRLEGDTAAAARFHMSVLEEVVSHGRPVRRPACVLSGGETTVRVAGGGRGGRNQEFVMHCVRHLAELPAPCLVASLGTDGTDGPTDAAGAVADNASLARSLAIGAAFLERSIEDNDSYAFFKGLGDLIVTGPTRTNVMDLHILLAG